ncbi:DUF4129 domain-containing protein [Natrarchaeobaculum aegyptiacum]|uniref:Protein-glutamine gamma-glutamyltransferase-like C-terminal domain-containing protein n=1 Tax=Natrarchaeobaculum aegyptiacum TaxID=745377 RepID=A0A2Z2HRZ2_9EURY|nr:DUF4129 domain-containing protein [Natrarchaeobaculum aegyptiacum]ARS88845.1 hypothetical protein B1756_03125 [Natrarchaeobaculum aegyptiacum]
MSRSINPTRLLAALCGITAVALAAATLPSPLETGGEGGDLGTGDGGDAERRPPGTVLEPEASEGVPPVLEYLAYLLVLLAAVALAWYLIVHRREVVKWLAVGAVVLFVLFVVGELLPTIAEPDLVPVEEQPPADDALPGEGDGEQTPMPVNPVVLVLAAVAAVFLIALLATRGGGSLPSPPGLRGDRSASTDSEPDAAAIADAAGRAADRIEDSTVDNDVYRAWQEMTELLEVDRPEVTTPRQFADAAVDAGMGPADVEELTRLFEDVRYGETEPTAELNERAKTVFRRIESEYGAPAATSSDERAARDESSGGETA